MLSLEALVGLVKPKARTSETVGIQQQAEPSNFVKRNGVADGDPLPIGKGVEVTLFQSDTQKVTFQTAAENTANVKIIESREDGGLNLVNHLWQPLVEENPQERVYRFTRVKFHGEDPTKRTLVEGVVYDEQTDTLTAPGVEISFKK